MDPLRSLKGRIGEAFVESILRRAGYKVSRIGRESQVQQMLRTGISEFLPDFLIWKQIDRTGGDASLNRVLSVEVKYHSDIPDFLHRYGGDLLLEVAEQWPELYIILVTDHPEPDRSCFQVIDLRDYRPGAPLTTADLHDLSVFDIYRSTVEEYEGLVKQVFALLGRPARSPELAQKPRVKMSAETSPVRLTAIPAFWP